MPADLLELENSTRRDFVLGAAALALLLSGCADDDDDANPTASPTASTKTVDDAFGAEEIPANPARVIADSVGTYAHLVSLGITPIAVALPTGISPEYISPDAFKMTNVVAEDGWTVNLEEALRIQPDLIVAVGADYNKENTDKYKLAVPTFAYKEHLETGTDEDIKRTIVDLAMALGREDEAAAGIAEYDRRVKELKDRIAAAGYAGLPVGIVRFDATGFIGLRIDQTPNAVLKALGFAAANFPAAKVDGYAELSLETLEILDEAEFLFVNTDDDVVLDQLAAVKTELWQRLDIVQDNRLQFVGAWNGGDLLQLYRMLDDIERAFVVPAEAGTLPIEGTAPASTSASPSATP